MFRGDEGWAARGRCPARRAKDERGGVVGVRLGEVVGGAGSLPEGTFCAQFGELTQALVTGDLNRRSTRRELRRSCSHWAVANATRLWIF